MYVRLVTKKDTSHLCVGRLCSLRFQVVTTLSSPHFFVNFHDRQNQMSIFVRNRQKCFFASSSCRFPIDNWISIIIMNLIYEHEKRTRKDETPMKIVLLERLRLGADISYECLKDFGEVIAYDQTNTPEEARARIKDADVVIVDQFPLNEETLKDAEHLKFITMTSTGTDFVDFSYTNTHGITVANIRGYSTDSVAQHTITMLLYLYEQLSFFNSYVKEGSYIDDTQNRSFSVPFHDLSGKIWGIVGLGQIGQKVATIAAALGCEIIYYSPSGRSYDCAYRQVDFETLLSESDVISLHSPLNGYTAGLFGYDEFCRMKRSAFFINSARGGLVQEDGLARAITEDRIQGAGLDVLTQEPMSPDCPLLPVLDSPKLLITPHMAWASVESRSRAMHEMYLNIQAWLNNTPRNICR